MVTDFDKKRLALHCGILRAQWLVGMLASLVAATVACSAPPSSQPANGSGNAIPAANSQPTNGRTAAVEAEIAIDSPNGEVGSFEMTIKFDPEQINLFDVESLVPDPIRLHVDRTQFASGIVRLVGTNAAPMESVRGAIARQHGPSGIFKVAKLYFTPATGMETALATETLTWEFLSCRAFTPLPEQENIAANFKVQFFRVMNVPATDS